MTNPASLTSQPHLDAYRDAIVKRIEEAGIVCCHRVCDGCRPRVVRLQARWAGVPDADLQGVLDQEAKRRHEQQESIRNELKKLLKPNGVISNPSSETT